MSVRSVRANNPCNIEAHAHWRGLQPPNKMTPAQEGERRFAVFSAPEWGFRAAAIILKNYGHDGLETIRQVISRWAPANENNVLAYCQHVSELTGFGIDRPIDLNGESTVRLLVKAMATHETGGWDGFWRDEDLRHGVSMAFGGRS